MKEVKYTCDKCKLVIDGSTTPENQEISRMRILGGGELCTLVYSGIMGHNEVPVDGWHFHYFCFLSIPTILNNLNHD